MPLVIIPDPDKDDAFVREYVRSLDAVASCAKARIKCSGYDMRDVAYTQMARPEIKQMIAAAQESASSQAAMEITKDSIISDLENVFDKAVSDGEYAPAIAAKKTQAEMMGLLQKNINLNVKNEVAFASDAELMKVIEGRAKDVTPRSVSAGPKLLQGIGREQS